MESVFTAFYHWVASQGIGVLALVIAVWWLNKQNQKEASNVKAALDAASTERVARYDLMAETVKNLTARVTACETDRGQLWAKIVDLASSKTKPNTP